MMIKMYNRSLEVEYDIRQSDDSPREVVVKKRPGNNSPSHLPTEMRFIDTDEMCRKMQNTAKIFNLKYVLCQV